MSTDYVVLSGGFDADDGTNDGEWTVYGTFAATSDKQAIRKAIEDGLKDVPSCVAVPARSFTPRKVTVKTETRILIGETK